jgi:nucleoside-diphosphate-sugar epimerase
MENRKKDGGVLVTGSSGFIGRAVVKLLHRTGCGVIPVDRTLGFSSMEENAHQYECDISDASHLQHVFQENQICGIIHLAAILPTAAQSGPLRATQVNIQGSVNVLEMARQFGIQRFVFASSLSVYGTWPAEQQVSEATKAAPEDLYGAAKLYVEQFGEAYGKMHGLEFVSLRIGRVVGPGAQSVTSAWRTQIFELLATSSKSEIDLPYVGSEQLLLVHIDEVARMLVTFLNTPNPTHRTYNAPCETIGVANLKREVEALNPKITVRLGRELPRGNPRSLDTSRFRHEFGYTAPSIFEQLREAAAR